jgi:hypothetical protein
MFLKVQQPSLVYIHTPISNITALLSFDITSPYSSQNTIKLIALLNEPIPTHHTETPPTCPRPSPSVRGAHVQKLLKDGHIL